MKHNPIPVAAVAPTLQDVLDRLEGDGSRLRDFRSAVVGYAKLVGQSPSGIALDLAAIRDTLDRAVPGTETMSAKRWANLRSDLAGAIAASGLRPMLRTVDVELDQAWHELLDPIKDQRIRNGLSRFARWASLRQIDPKDIEDAAIERFVAELHAGTLVRQIRDQHRRVAVAWNRLAALEPWKLRMVQVPSSKPAPTRVAWEQLPASFRDDVERHLAWAAVPDPLD
jgi:hypothetical protein